MTPHTLLRFNCNVFPLHLIENKYRWKEVKNIAEIIELKGKEKRKFHTSSNSVGLWDKLVDSSSKDEKVYNTRGLR